MFLQMLIFCITNDSKTRIEIIQATHVSQYCIQEDFTIFQVQAFNAVLSEKMAS